MKNRALVNYFLSNQIYDYLLGENWYESKDQEVHKQADLIEEKIEKPALKIICDMLGHRAEKDMCLKPEHDYCVWCLKIMPGAAHEEA